MAVYISRDDSNALAHHGVKGMKWGVRHDRSKSDNLRKKTTRSKVSNYIHSDRFKENAKFALKTFGASTIAGAAIALGAPAVGEAIRIASEQAGHLGGVGPAGIGGDHYYKPRGDSSPLFSPEHWLESPSRSDNPGDNMVDIYKYNRAVGNPSHMIKYTTPFLFTLMKRLR